MVRFAGYEEEPERHALDLSYLRRLWPFARPYRGAFGLALLILAVSFVLEGQTIIFEGSATDPDEGELSGDALIWTSSIEGEIGTGTTFERADLSPGTHIITLLAIDSQGAIGAAAVLITIIALVPGPGI